MYTAFLAIDGPDSIEQANLQFFDLLQVVFLRQELHAPRIRAHPVRTIRARIAVCQLDREGDGVADREVRQGFTVLPIDLLLASITQLRYRKGDLLFTALVESVGDECLANAVVVPGPEGKVEVALERREQVSGGGGEIDARCAIGRHL